MNTSDIVSAMLNGSDDDIAMHAHTLSVERFVDYVTEHPDTPLTKRQVDTLNYIKDGCIRFNKQLPDALIKCNHLNEEANK